MPVGRSEANGRSSRSDSRSYSATSVGSSDPRYATASPSEKRRHRRNRLKADKKSQSPSRSEPVLTDENESRALRQRPRTALLPPMNVMAASASERTRSGSDDASPASADGKRSNGNGSRRRQHYSGGVGTSSAASSDGPVSEYVYHHHRHSPAPIASVRQLHKQTGTQAGADGKRGTSAMTLTVPKGSNFFTWMRKLIAESLGAGMLTMAVVSSTITAERLSSMNFSVYLLMPAFTTVCVAYGLIVVLGPISGAHFNPVLSMVDLLHGDMGLVGLVLYVCAQCLGAVVGCFVANLQHDVSSIATVTSGPIFDKLSSEMSVTERWGTDLWISEFVATTTLIVLVHGCIRAGNQSKLPTAASLWMGASVVALPSNGFANPALTVGRVFTRTEAGIEPDSAIMFVVVQIVGGFVGFVLTKILYPTDQIAQPARTDDTLYRRAHVLANHRQFYNNGHY